MVLVYFPTKLDDFVRANGGKYSSTMEHMGYKSEHISPHLYGLYPNLGFFFHRMVPIDLTACNPDPESGHFIARVFSEYYETPPHLRFLGFVFKGSFRKDA
jgi:hypothetical protein